MGAHDPAAAHGAGFAVEVAVAEGEAAEDAFGFGFEGVAAEFVEAGEGFVVDFFVAALGFVFLDGFFEGGDFGGDGGGEFEDGFVCGGGGFLGEVAEGAAAVEDDAAVVGGVAAEDEGEEGGFARAVGADEADAFSVVDLEGDVLEEGAGAVGFRDFGEREHGERARMPEGSSLGKLSSKVTR